MIGIGKNLFKSNVKAAGVPSFVGLLDTYPNASAAYSLRKLRNAYAGNCIRVRRSSDNTEQNIGFVNNVLDTASLLTFCGAANGFVTTWYDQSGNANNVSQIAATSQPQIVTSGSLITSNGKNALNFDGIDDSLSRASIMTGATARTQLVVYQPNNSTGTFTYSIFGQSGGTAGNGTWSIIQDRTAGVTGDPYFAGFSADLGNGLSTPNTLQKLAQFYYTGTNGSLYKNSNLLQSANISLNSPSNGLLGMGGSTSGGEFANSKITECIIYLTNQITNRTGIENNINTFYSIY